MPAPVYRSSIFVGEKNLMPTTTADGFRQLEREIPEYVANYVSLHPSTSGGIYPAVPVPTSPTGYYYYWDSTTGIYWAQYSSTTNRWKMATNMVHTSLYQSTAVPIPAAPALFQWDSTLVDWSGCWDQVYPYTYIFPINGYYLVSWQIMVNLGSEQVQSWVQTRVGTGTWTTVARGNNASAVAGIVPDQVTGGTTTLQVGVQNPAANAAYQVPSPYRQMQLWWWCPTPSPTHSCDTGQAITYMTIDLIGTIDSTS